MGGGGISLISSQEGGTVFVCTMGTRVFSGKGKKSVVERGAFYFLKRGEVLVIERL